jgi:uncharacterized protein (DUF305 family)
MKKEVLYGIAGLIIGGTIIGLVAMNVANKNETKQEDTMTMNSMVDDLKGKTGDEFDKVFISGMIEHHQGAIDMAHMAKQNAKHDEIKTMADDIISAQSKEIDMMKQWQIQWGYKPAENNSTMDHSSH